MGGQNSALHRNLEDEFQRLAKGGRGWLTLDDMLLLRVDHISGSPWLLDPAHLGVMWVLDSDHSGQISLAKLEALADLARGRSRRYQPHEFQAQMQGFCTLQLWRDMAQEGGQEAFIDWLCRLLLLNKDGTTVEAREFARYRGHQYINRDCAEALHHILHVQETQGLDFQSFFDLLQRAGEEMELMDLDDEELDDWLPLEVVQTLLWSMNAGMAKVIADILPASEIGHVV